jgi:hypothetical protein
MDEKLRQSVIQALQKVREHFETEEYTPKNLQVRMRGANLLAMALLNHRLPAKGEIISEDWLGVV